ncbi:hypothetical protein Sru01_06590 [Sphaerisporangium rufum]|uniref:Uncharacterized protein n=1 Tax=Sphaerisporangium rufum TaxID=1381558 RepID=A0A919QXB4_9ACTN|nr:hypothetical protein [Sphaerisporangium rufum]GII75677.1 hypothetical protein Sru01_06590 [Sphaerisporangium rufum]
MTSGRYRTIFHTNLAPADAFATAARELRSWLVVKSRHKPIDVRAYDDGHARLGPGIMLLPSSRTEPDGTRTQQWQLREHDGNGYWLSSLTVHAPAKRKDGHRTWFWLDVEHVPTADGVDAGEEPRSHRAAVPGIVRSLLQVVDAYDHWAMLTPEPALVRTDDVETLLEILTDEDRRLPTVVASPHDTTPFETWREKVRCTTKHLPGLASLYILDPPAAEQFNKAVGAAYSVRGGAIRTYLPALDLALDEDAARHRVLSGARIETDQHTAARLLAGAPRRLTADGRLPDALVRLNRTAVTASPAPVTRKSPVTAGMDFSVLLGENMRLNKEIDELRELLEYGDHERRNSDEKAATLTDDLLNTVAELEVANQAIAELSDSLRVLRRRFHLDGRPAEAYLPEGEPVRLPIRLPDVLDRLEELDRIEFTGDPGTVWKLDSKAQSSNWAQTTWMTLLAMQDYVEAVVKDEFNGDFRRWCAATPPGARSISAGKVTPDESDTVKNNTKMRRQREFRVPTEVSPSGRVFMWSHIRLGGGAGISAPRMHFHDDARGTVKVYIGYIGPHLDVRTTN